MFDDFYSWQKWVAALVESALKSFPLPAFPMDRVIKFVIVNRTVLNQTAVRLSYYLLCHWMCLVPPPLLHPPTVVHLTAEHVTHRRFQFVRNRQFIVHTRERSTTLPQLQLQLLEIQPILRIPGEHLTEKAHQSVRQC